MIRLGITLAAIILIMFILCRFLGRLIRKRTADAIDNLINLTPKNAVIVDAYGREKEIDASDLAVGDIFVVRPGESVPVDGIVVEGNAAVNESVLTGDSTPVDKGVGATVLAATTNSSGYLKCRATRIQDETTLSQIIRIVRDASATKAPIVAMAEKITRILLPVVIGIAAVTFISWFVITKDVVLSLTRALTVLVISTPFAPGITAAAAVMTGSGAGARNGIFFRTGTILENVGKTQILAFDKTGTITKGEPVVTDVFTVDAVTRSGYSLINTSENELLKLAGLLERKSDHPLAKAVVSYVGDLRAYYEDLDEEEEDITNFQILPGHGLKGEYMGHEIIGASLKYISGIVTMQKEVREKAIGLSAQGKTTLCFAKDKRLIGIIAVADNVKNDSATAIKELKDMGIHTVMLTGDNDRTAMAIGDQAGVDEIASEILPDGKEAVIDFLSRHGRTSMAGDAINEAEAIKRADIGIAVDAASDIGKVEGEVILMKNTILDVSGAIRLSRATLSNVHMNLLLIFLYNLIAIPFAAGVFEKILVFQPGPVIGALVMSLFNILVVAKALRLNTLDIRDKTRDKRIRNSVDGDLLQSFHPEAEQ